MSLKTRGFVAFLTTAAVLAIAGLVLTNLPSLGACAGPVFDSDLCESARLRQLIVASTIAASGVLSVGVLMAALVVGSVRGSDAPDSR